MFLLLLLFAAQLPAKELARWDAASPSPRERGITLEKAADSPVSFEPGPGGTVARLQPASDYYTRSAFLLRFERPGTARQWLSIEFADRGYGLITISPTVAEIKQSGIARVNSGRIRHAAFEFEGGVPERIRVEGLDHLRAVIVTDTAPPAEHAPIVEPAIRFARHSERVSAVPGDANTPEQVEHTIAGIRNQAPLLRALGFNAVETFVRWGHVERQPGVYDWSFYDSILAEIERNGLKWFPMLLAGSGYALPKWFYESKDNRGFKCLEHGIVHDTQTIFDPRQTEYASRFIAEFGKHYRGHRSLLGIRLGPSGDYGEAQYPARGPGFGFRQSHTHIGYWAGDDLAAQAFRDRMQSNYGGDIARLNEAWQAKYGSFAEVRPFLPETALTRRQRIDFANWYMGAMSEWCDKWAVWSRAALPGTQIHQSSGGWGPVPIGTDYSFQARSAARIGGGIRLTNEGDDFADNFTITRMANSAARFYGAQIGYEPGGYGSKRGVMARLYNAVTTGAVHLFYYMSNIALNDQAIDAWLRNAHLLDERAKPLIDVAAFYSDTALKLDDEVVRYRWASTFFTVGRTLREQIDFDYASEQMIEDGALQRYKVLLFLWGTSTEKPVLEKIDQWVRDGGTVVFAPRGRGYPVTVEGDFTIANRWIAGDTGRGRAVVWRGEVIPGRDFSHFVRELVRDMPNVNPAIRETLRIRKPEAVYVSTLENGKRVFLNYTRETARVELSSGRAIEIAPFEPHIE